MNKLKQVFMLLLCAVALYVRPMQAQETESQLALLSHDKEARLIYAKEKAGPVLISVSDAKGKLISKTEVRTKGSFVQPFSFVNLPPGLYFIEVEDSGGTWKRALRLRGSKATTAKLLLKPLKDDALLLTLLRHEPGPLTVTFLCEGEELYQETIYDVVSFSKRYRFTALPLSELTVRVSEKFGHVISEHISL